MTDLFYSQSESLLITFINRKHDKHIQSNTCSSLPLEEYIVNVHDVGDICLFNLAPSWQNVTPAHAFVQHAIHHGFLLCIHVHR